MKKTTVKALTCCVLFDRQAAGLEPFSTGTLTEDVLYLYTVTVRNEHTNAHIEILRPNGAVAYYVAFCNVTVAWLPLDRNEQQCSVAWVASITRSIRQQFTHRCGHLLCVVTREPINAARYRNCLSQLHKWLLATWLDGSVVGCVLTFH